MRRVRPGLVAVMGVGWLLATGCGSSGDKGGGDAVTEATEVAPEAVEALDEALDAPAEESVPHGPYDDPRTVVPTSALDPVRGKVWRRGILHLHSTYSHDGCDNTPLIDDHINQECLTGERAAFCDTAQDFIFLTDHSTLYADYEYPDVLLHRASEGDQLLMREGAPVANRVACPGGGSVLLMAGCEGKWMPIGLERHVGATPDERRAALSNQTAAGAQALKDAGGLVMVMHTEEWDAEGLLSLPLDGFEMYNTHYNLMANMGTAALLLGKMTKAPETIPVPELALLGIFQERDEYLLPWAQVLLKRKSTTYLGTDAHQNVFKEPTYDGDRLDSFRRMMHWFSNYVQLDPAVIGTDGEDRALKEAVRQGHLFGAFHYLGYPMGFDYHATRGDDVYEMGDSVKVADGTTLHVTLPRVHNPDPANGLPGIRGRILKATEQGWVEVTSFTQDLSIAAPGKGVYRAEVRMTPNHLRPWAGTEADKYLGEKVWIYSNPIYVGMLYYTIR
jgi:hypothetical protein